MKVTLRAALLFLVSISARAEDRLQDEACEVPDPEVPVSSSALLQVQANKEGPPNMPHQDFAVRQLVEELYSNTESYSKAEGPESHKALVQKDGSSVQACSYQLHGDQDGSKQCSHLQGKKYTSGREAALDEAGYQQVAKLCCHHEMSLFVRREIARQGFDVCDLSDLHGFVHWYDCTKAGADDKKTYAEMRKEIAGVMKTACPWLGHLPFCPKKDPVHCGRIATKCAGTPPANALAGSTAPLSTAGYAAVALRCCHNDMAKYVRREIDRQGFRVCDEGSFQGFLHWFDCTDDDQSYEALKEGLVIARSGLPPMCPWLGDVGQACPPTGHNCPVVEVPEPAAHRRRIACR